MMKKLLILLLWIAPIWASATHIVGGEFRLIHKQGYQFELRLVQYFDEVNGDPEAEDDFATVYIFRKSDNVNVRILNVNQLSSSFVPYTNPSCTDESILFRQIIYSADLTLAPADFNDPEGYYAVFERCCRNNIVSNLVSPESTGQTFYMEFPPVVINNQPFVNSSPELSAPISDYACINKNFMYDFGASDPDGDSLVYSLSTPLNSSRFEPVPTPSSAPHRPVTFRQGINENNMVPGVPPLRIDNEGKLRVIPSTLGVFVFGIKVEEYRNGQKIGEVRRDYQLLVVDCNPGEAPEIFVRHEGAFVNDEELLSLSKDGDRCIEILVTDQDPDELIRVSAEGINFDNDISSLISPSLQLMDGPNDTLRFELCLPQCPYTEGPMQIRLIAFDDACSQPLSDTIAFRVEIVGADDSDPFIVNNPNVVEVALDEGEAFTYPIRGLDEDGDLLSLEAIGDGFSISDYGMRLEERLLVPGEVQKVFRWTPECENIDFSKGNKFEVEVILSDNSDCPFGETDILLFRFTVNPPVNERPRLTIQGLDEREVSIRIDETLAFDVLAEDFDDDFIVLNAVGDGFELNDYNMYFPGNQGIKSVESPFSWRLSCNVIDLAEKSKFVITFLARDNSACGVPSMDSLKVTVNVLPPLNEAPELFVRNFESGDTIVAMVNRPVSFDVISNDVDNDIITLRLSRVVFNGTQLDTEVVNFNFFPARGRGTVGSRFNWLPGCETVGQTNRDSFVELFFVAEDSKCFNIKNDTVSIILQITDEALNLEAYQPRNAITPNGDQQGDFFFLRFCNNPEGECDLPFGNCANIFQRIDIFNRWGKKVFTSSDVNFEWHAEGISPGVYYYTIYYNNDNYKGQVYVYLRDPN
ncbi:T9SS type B sorting domain-containing protein [Catalinimonas niigatensis]|uniref:T9SS type B sorting domain-containing protein n=1 Tax=Catalinimonas niigatensis TaxID=1397264 RepID=UPI002664F6CB|nr:gliding motility-associated C-terminal domain-containing protein [Catalinimonas niigatensis]WPP52184.1 gliding motility-associated C-terminal domain-containing protein [Catalinimonas niigatensis]